MNGENKQYSDRLTQSPAKAIQEYYTLPRLRVAGKVFPIYMMVFKAHAVMLAEREIIAREDARAILRELTEIETAGFDALPLRSDLNDLYLNLQMIIMDHLGEKVGGWLHMALSRNDFELAEARFYCRERINEGVDALLKLMGALLDLAEKHVETVMPGYTHMSQAAQPITLAHFLLAHYDVFARDVERLEQAYAVTNRSPLGGCALATTGFPIHRERVAQLVGCDGLVENSLDATGGRDFLLQFGSAVAIAFSNMGRLVESLLLWNTREFGMIELADQYCHISSIMPQKKNPVTLEIIRGESVRVPDAINSAFGVLKAIPLGNGREPSYVESSVFESAEKLETLAPVLADVVATLNINKDIMLQKSRQDFSTMTELADEIVRQTDLSFHQSYIIVGKMVAQVNRQGQLPESITSEAIDVVAQNTLGRALHIPQDAVKRALDPIENVHTRNVRGGPAPVEVRRMLEDRRKQQDNLKRQLQDRRNNLANALEALNFVVSKMISETTRILSND
jgi:argininosuccinate lyase